MIGNVSLYTPVLTLIIPPGLTSDGTLVVTPAINAAVIIPTFDATVAYASVSAV